MRLIAYSAAVVRAIRFSLRNAGSEHSAARCARIRCRVPNTPLPEQTQHMRSHGAACVLRDAISNQDWNSVEPTVEFLTHFLDNAISLRVTLGILPHSPC